MMALLASALTLIVRLCPLRLSDRVTGKLMEGLPKKFGARPSEMNPFGSSTGLLDGSNTAVTEHLIGILVAISAGAESYDQAGSQCRSGARQGGKQSAVGMRRD